MEPFFSGGTTDSTQTQERISSQVVTCTMKTKWGRGSRVKEAVCCFIQGIREAFWKSNFKKLAFLRFHFPFPPDCDSLFLNEPPCLYLPNQSCGNLDMSVKFIIDYMTKDLFSPNSQEQHWKLVMWGAFPSSLLTRQQSTGHS